MGADLPQVDGGVVADGGKRRETVEERGREPARRRVDAVVGRSSPVKGLSDISGSWNALPGQDIR